MEPINLRMQNGKIRTYTLEAVERLFRDQDDTFAWLLAQRIRELESELARVGVNQPTLVESIY
jgi:hypothetical protein